MRSFKDIMGGKMGEKWGSNLKLLDREIRTLAHTKYPETSWLEQIPESVRSLRSILF
jgi:hypothetical protein